MNSDLLQQVASMQVKRRKKRVWKRIVSVISCIVVFCTTYALILPAITMENKITYCNMVEHTHIDSCYEIQLSCPYDEEHTHTEACYTEETRLVCGIEDSKGHAHTKECYTETQQLVCTNEAPDHKHIETCYETIQELACELVESKQHVHTEECYERVQELTCESVESESHIHTEECYERVQICTVEEHTHDIMCYSDPSADVESQEIWESSLAGAEHTGVWMEDILSIANTQVGYHESERNYIVDEEGQLYGYTRYGAWYGTPYSNWNTLFVSFCLNYANVPEEVILHEINCQNWQEQFIATGLWRDNSYTPNPGDIIFFDLNGDGTSTNVGVVQMVNSEENTISTIEGDQSNAVAVCEYNLTSSDILGYCDITAAYDAYCNIVVEEPEEPMVLVEQQLTATIYTDSTYTELGEELTVITVSGELPENAVIKAYPVSPQNEELAEVSIICAYDISIFTAEGEVFQPAEDVPLTVMFSLPQEPGTEAIGDDYDEDGFITEIVTVGAAHISEEDVLEQIEPTVEENTVSFTTNHFSTFVVYKIIEQREIIPGESIEDDSAFQALVESGYFTYWEQFLTEDSDSRPSQESMQFNTWALSNRAAASASQITNSGGTNNSGYNDDVSVSKTIAGTDIENVFDITLTVNTSTNISEFYREPDMAVVIVMDISNTMKDAFGGVTRYSAAMTAAEQFIDELTAVSNGVSKVGFVAFNTDAHKIFDLSSCSTTAEATSLKNTMRAETGKIINRGTNSEGKDIYGQSHDRFTNIEAGLKLGRDMLASAANENKYIIFLSDGFPTTYISSGYNGYDPYTPRGTVGNDGVFYDQLDGTYCLYGTSYSDKAAARAQAMAAEIKDRGIQIFSIGVDVGGQTISRYDTHRGDSFSVIDRTGNTYVIGGADNVNHYANWLRNSIGSGYYYPSTNLDDLKDAYTSIFNRIKEIHEAGSSAQWVANDPMGTVPGENVEFIGFYDKNGNLVSNYGALIGSWAEYAENTASVDSSHSSIFWDLKSSGYTTTTEDSTTMYYYTITYRVRLENELSGFIENTSYNTNNTTTLTYKTFSSTDGNINFSEQRTIEFPIPAVKGYLGELIFAKKGSAGNPLSGAEFTLTHDTEQCNICRGNGTAVEIGAMKASSDGNGTVTFTAIPSGHTYIMEETYVPEGHWSNGDTYSVTVAYDVVTVTVTHSDGTTGTWDGNVINVTQYTLPETGGVGTTHFTFAGIALIVFSALVYGYKRRRRERRLNE